MLFSKGYVLPPSLLFHLPLRDFTPIFLWQDSPSSVTASELSRGIGPACPAWRSPGSLPLHPIWDPLLGLAFLPCSAWSLSHLFLHSFGEGFFDVMPKLHPHHCQTQCFCVRKNSQAPLSLIFVAKKTGQVTLDSSVA